MLLFNFLYQNHIRSAVQTSFRSFLDERRHKPSRKRSSDDLDRFTGQLLLTAINEKNLSDMEEVKTFPANSLSKHL